MVESKSYNFKRAPISGAEVYYCEKSFSANEASTHLKILEKHIKWKQNKITLFGQQIPEPRLSCWFGEKPYSYSGLMHKSMPYPSQLLPIMRRVKKITGENFNGVLLNLYRDGSDSMGWHSDNEPELGKDPVIASVSFGATRNFLFKRKDNSSKPFCLTLESGSLLLMKGNTQENWFHKVPKTKINIGIRINLTFRTVQY